jgi:hypothetical protein
MKHAIQVSKQMQRGQAQGMHPTNVLFIIDKADQANSAAIKCMNMVLQPNITYGELHSLHKDAEGVSRLGLRDFNR